MSRHRIAVHNLVDAMARLAERELSDAIVQSLTTTGRSRARITVPPIESELPAALVPLSESIEQIVTAARIDDFREACVVIELTPGERLGRCVAGNAVTSRRLAVITISIEARVKTRWVDMSEQREATRQWALA